VDSGGASTVTAYSSVTGRSYTMTQTGTNPVVFTGGNNALAQFYAGSAPAQQAAPPADTIITRFRGTASGHTGTFTVPADGNWHLSYAYTNGSLFAGQAENFQVYEYSTDGTLVDVLVNDLGVGRGTPTAVPVYSDPEAGSPVYFQVVTEDARWELVPVTGTS
jgi:VCBS repeat-containing protein